MQTEFLKVEKLVKKFGAFTAVNEVSFSITQGESFALLGESGCGKTTLLRSLAGLETPNSGKIQLAENLFFENKSLIPVNQRNVGLVFQDYAVFPHKSVEENITFGVKDKTQKQKKLEQMLKLFKLSDQLGKMPDQLSGGQLQRVAIARTLASDPSLMLLDEPFSNLDKQLGIQLRNELKEIFKTRNLASILVTHDQQEAFAYADRVAVMKDGEILQCGTPEEVYLSPKSLEVAEFLGDCQFIEGHATGDCVETILGELKLKFPMTGKVKVLVRPENIALQECDEGQFGLISSIFLGSTLEAKVSLDSLELKAVVPSYRTLNSGSRVNLNVKSPVVAFQL